MAGMLLQKMEEAGVALIRTLTFQVAYTINPAETSDEKVMSCIIVEASDTGEEVPLGTGNYVTKLRVTLKNNPDDVTDAKHKADCKTLVDALRSDSIGASLSALVAEFYVYDPPKSSDFSKEENASVHAVTVELDLLACESDL